MIGNDLVWLSGAENRASASSARYRDRVFDDSEREAWQMGAATWSPASAGRWFWSFWAAKEAAFKAFHRHHRDLHFHPRDWSVRGDLQPRPRSGIVRHDQHEFRVRWIHGPAWVHALVSLPGHDAQGAVGRWSVNESEGTRAWASGVLGRLCPSRGRVIDRPPVFETFSGQRQPVSLSHDGPWCAVAVLA